ncbi:MAG: hypothetical protein AB1531_01705, partial [Chloroflexota bacterium]
FGGLGDDRFQFTGSVRLDGSVDGEGGRDELDYNYAPLPYLSPRALDLTGFGSIDGFDGTETAPIPSRPELGTISGMFHNMEVLHGSPWDGDSLQGLPNDSLWTIDGLDSAYLPLPGGLSLAFDNLDTLIGEAGADEFTFADGATLSGSVIGAGGQDVLNYTSYLTARTVTLSGFTADGASGSQASLGIGFQGIDLLIGTSFSDTLVGSGADNVFFPTVLDEGRVDATYAGGILTGGLIYQSIENLDGGAGVNSLDYRAYAGPAAVYLETSTTTALSGSWTNLQALVGSTQTTLYGHLAGDIFTVTGLEAGTVAGFQFSSVPTIAGMSGYDSLNSTAAAPFTVTLTGHTADGFSGRIETLIAFLGMDLWTGSGSDTLVAPDLPGTFVIDDLSTHYQDEATLRTFDFNGVFYLVGGTSTDTFAMLNTAVWPGRFDGGAGIDTLDYSAYALAVEVDLVNHTATNVLDGVYNIENLLGSPVGNIIMGDEFDNLLIGTGAVDQIYGLGGNDILIGMGGDDLLDGGPGTDTASYLYSTLPVTASLVTNQASGADCGTDSLVSIENLEGGAGNDTLTGNTAANVLAGGGGNDQLNGGAGNDTYRFTDGWGQDVISDSSGTDHLDFSPVTLSSLTFDLRTTGITVSTLGGDLLTAPSVTFEQLTGGAGADIFNVFSGFILSGLLDGLGDADLLDFSDPLRPAGITVTLTGAGLVDGMNGTVAGVLPVGFANINSLTGTIHNDTLIGSSADTTFFVTGSGLGSVDGLLDYALFENLNGGLGTNSMDYSLHAGAATFNLDAHTATGVPISWTNFQALVGNADTTLVGPVAGSLYNITAVDAGNVAGFTFTHVPSLTAGSGNDTFLFQNGAALSGALDAGLGTDLLDYSAYLSAVDVDLQAGTLLSGGVSGLVAGVENITGGLGDDLLTGDVGANTLIGGPGSDTLTGGAGDDTYIFTDGWGAADVVVEVAAGGTDTLDLTAVTAPLDITIGSAALTISGSGSSLSHFGDQVEAIRTGSGADTVHFTGTGSLAGSIDLGGGGNTFDYSAYSAPAAVDLAAGTATGVGSFNHLQALIGNSITTLTGYLGSTFTITGADDGTVTSGANVFTFTDVPTLVGSGLADTFIVQASGSLSGGLNGDAGSDTLTFAPSNVARSLVLAGADASGFNGNETAINLFQGISMLVGGTGADLLTGVSSPATFELDGADRYLLGAYALAFSSLETLAGGSAADLFQVTGPRTYNLIGNGDNDTFAFTSGALLTGSLAGGAGSDTLQCGGACSVTLTAANLVDGGFDGTTPLATLGFTSLDVLQGSTAVDTLTGTAAGGTFLLASYQYQFGGSTIIYNAIENLFGGPGADLFDLDGSANVNLNGGAGDDVFLFSNTTALNGTLNGGDGLHDLLDYHLVTIDVSVSFASGYATGVRGGAPGSISNVEDFIGGSGLNRIYGDNNANLLKGGTSDDILIGMGGNDTYLFFDNWGNDIIQELPGGGNDTLDFSNITVPGSGTLTFTFDPGAINIHDGSGSNTVGADYNVDNFIAGPGDDTFIFNGTTSIAGSINGGVRNNTLDFSAYGTWRDFILTGMGSLSGFNGQVANLGGGFYNISTLLGTADPHGDSLTGMNAPASWLLNGAVSQYISSNTLEFSAIEGLDGGSASDDFVFANGAIFTGGLDAHAGIDALDLHLYTTPVDIDLDLGRAILMGATIPITGFERLIGGTADDHICGGSGDEWITGGPGDDVLCGHAGNDTFWFEDNWGSDTVSENENEGIDTMDFGGVTVNLRITLGSIYNEDIANPLVNNVLHADTWIEIMRSGSGDDLFTIPGIHAVSLYGGAGNDTFDFADSAFLTGILDGEAGFDTLDYFDILSPYNVTLTGVVANGFSGTQPGSLSSGFSGIDNLIGSQASGDSLTGMNATALWTLDGTDTYLSGGVQLSLSGFSNLIGGLGADTFDIIGARTYSLLNGSDGNDTFTFDHLASLSGIIEGGSGANTLDFNRYHFARDITLTGTSSLVGFNGTQVAIGGGFYNIVNLVGSQALDDSLNGLSAPSIWNITAPDQGTYTSLDRTLSFSGIESLNGETYEDQYIFSPSGSLTGSINGRGGMDILDLSALSNDFYIELTGGLVMDLWTWIPLVSGGLTSVEHMRTGRGMDYLLGDSRDNILEPDGGVNYVCGGDGYDIVIVQYGSIVIDLCGDIEEWIYLPPPSPGSQPQSVVPVSGLPIRVIPVVHLELVGITCDLCSGIILRLPEGNQVEFGCGLGNEALLEDLRYHTLPAPLPDGMALVFGMRPRLFDRGEQLQEINGIITVSFIVPQWLERYDLVILFWDEQVGAWVEVSSNRVPAFLLGERRDRQQARVDQLGVYVLALPGVHTSLVCSGTQDLLLHSGDRLTVPCGAADEARLTPRLVWSLPTLPAARTFLSAFTVTLLAGDGPVDTLPSGSLTLAFDASRLSAGTIFEVLYWEETTSTWQQVTGAALQDGRVQVVFDRPGTYALVEDPSWISLECTGEHSFPLPGGSLSLSCLPGTTASLRVLDEQSLPYAPPFDAALGLAFSLDLTVDASSAASFPAGMQAFLLLPQFAGDSLYRYDASLYGVGGWLELGVLPAEGMPLDQPGTYLLIP